MPFVPPSPSPAFPTQTRRPPGSYLGVRQTALGSAKPLCPFLTAVSCVITPTAATLPLPGGHRVCERLPSWRRLCQVWAKVLGPQSRGLVSPLPRDSTGSANPAVPNNVFLQGLLDFLSAESVFRLFLSSRLRLLSLSWWPAPALPSVPSRSTQRCA